MPGTFNALADTNFQTILDSLELLHTQTASWRDRAAEWAAAPENVEVDSGKYSAMHYALKAEGSRLAADLAEVAAQAAQLAAETALSDAVLAQAASEAAQQAAELAQGIAESEADAAGIARQGAETAEDYAVQAQVFAEDAQSAAETSEGNAADSADRAEDERGAAEQAAALAMQYRNQAGDFSDIAESYAHYEGVWSTMSGALPKPASVFHNDTFWMALDDIADVAASEPDSENPDWSEIGDSVKSVAGKTGAVDLVVGDVAGLGGALTAITEDVGTKASKGDVTLTVTDLAGLKGVAGAFSGQTAFMPYRTEPGDQGGGEFVWDDESTEADNHGTIFAVAGVETGRWKRILHNNTVNFDMFGAIKGETDENGEVNALAMRRCFAALQDNMTVRIVGTYHLGSESPSARTSQNGITIDGYAGKIIYTHVGGQKPGFIFRFGEGTPAFNNLKIMGLNVVNDIETPDPQMVGFSVIQVEQGRYVTIRDVNIFRCAYYGIVLRRATGTGKMEHVYIDNVIMRECASGISAPSTPQFPFFAGAFGSGDQNPELYMRDVHVTNCIFDTTAWHENTASRLPCKLHGFRNSSFTNVQFLGLRHPAYTTSEIEIDKGWDVRWENCYFQNRVECYSSSLQAELNYTFINCRFGHTIGVYTRDNDARNVYLKGCRIDRRIAHNTRTGGRVIGNIVFEDCTISNISDTSVEFIIELSEFSFIRCRFDFRNDTRFYIRGKGLFQECDMDFKTGRLYMQRAYEGTTFRNCSIRNVSFETFHDRTVLMGNVIEVIGYSPASSREVLQLNGSNDCQVIGNYIRVGSSPAPSVIIRATTSNHRVMHNTVIQDAPQSSRISNPIFTQSGSIQANNFIDVNN